MDVNVCPAWIQELIRLVERTAPREFVGQVEVNIFQGGVSNVNLKQSYKKTK